MLCLLPPTGRADAPYATSFKADAVGAMPAGWSDISGTAQFVTDSAARSGSRSFYQEADAAVTEARYTWGPAAATPWSLSFSLMISSNTTQAVEHTVGFGLLGADTWGATGVYIGWDDTDDHWELRGAGDAPPPVIQTDTWYDLGAEFDGGTMGTGTAKWYLDGVSLGAADLAEVRGPDAYFVFDTSAATGSAYGFVDDINAQAVPEPTGAAVLLAAGAVARRRRRRTY
ncbi:MAG: PEP-CTERM sorting domain-containing protein [Planctomycetota bacterium]